jgi:hypothetical protein
MKLTDVSNLTRDQVVPFYTYQIITHNSDEEVKRLNDLILSKWSKSGLIYIKEKAWKLAAHLGYTFENGWGAMTLPEMYNSVQSLKNQAFKERVIKHLSSFTEHSR